MTSMTGMEGAARGTESGDEEGMTVIPSADTDEATTRHEAFLCGCKMNGMEMDGWQEWQHVTHQTPRANVGRV